MIQGVNASDYGEDSESLGQFVDDFTDMDNISANENVIRNETLDCMELNQTSVSLVVKSPIQIREHDRSVSYTPFMTYSKGTDYIQCISTTTSLGYSWIFLHFDTEWINGKYIRLKWYHSGYSMAYARLYDGNYSRKSLTTFPPNANAVFDGNGYLGDIATVDDSTDTDDCLIDSSGASLNTVTLMIFISDAWTSQALTYRLYWIEVNEAGGGSENLLKWDMGKSGTALTMETSGTYNDWGRVDGGDIEDYESGGYALEGYFYTTELLENINGNSLTLLTNSTLNDGNIKLQLSKDNSTWVNHNNQTGYDYLVSGYEALDLRDLNFNTIYMRYNFTRGGLILTPRLFQIRLISTEGVSSEGAQDSDAPWIAIAIILMLIAFLLFGGKP